MDKIFRDASSLTVRKQINIDEIMNDMNDV